MKTLVIVEHDNKSIKQSTFSTITAASKIGDDVEAIIVCLLYTSPSPRDPT